MKSVIYTLSGGEFRQCIKIYTAIRDILRIKKEIEVNPDKILSRL